MTSVEQLAAERRLTPSRMPAVFLNLRRNTRTWTQDSFPISGERRSFGDAAVFQYVPGRGMQLHPLATWGRVNWQLRICLLTRGARLRGAQAAAADRRARAAAGAARRLRRVGVLLRVRAGLAAVDERHGAGDRDPGALARGDRARRAPLRAARAARARRVRDAAAGGRRGPRGRRAALRHVLVRARAADPQRRAAGDQRPARRRRARRATSAPRGWSRAATAPPAPRSAASTPARGRSTRRPAASRRSPTTS